MADTITKDNLFHSVRPRPQSRADITDSTARAIIKAEAESREAKTRRLRRARLEMEANCPEPAPTRGRAGKAARSATSRRAA